MFYIIKIKNVLFHIDMVRIVLYHIKYKLYISYITLNFIKKLKKTKGEGKNGSKA